MKVLSLFDGMSCGRIALERNGVNVEQYYAAEIDKFATKVSEHNYPDIVRLGDVTKWQDWNIDWSEIDLVLGGFPCQAWSIAGKQLGDKDERGMLFWTMLDIIKHVRKHNPNADFLIENVKMKKEFEEYITHHAEQALGTVHKILINSALVSAQNRNRYYWTSWECSQPEDKGIVLADILEDGVVDRNKSHCIDANYFKGGNLKSYFEKNRRQVVFENPAAIVGRKLDESGRRDDKLPCKPTQCLEVSDNKKSRCLSTVQKDTVVPCLPPGRYPVKSEQGNVFIIQRGRGNNLGGIKAKDGKVPTVSSNSWEHNNHLLYSDCHYRKLTPIECERLQTVPDNFSSCVSNTQRYKMLGNGWTVDVICHLLKGLD
jgi:DNA-cytosine methyltransferase